MPRTHAEGPVRVLAVCTGNVCRSPVVERLLAAGLGGAYRGVTPSGLAPAIALESAGTHALVDQPMTPDSVDLLDAVGVPSGGFAARQLTADLVRDAHLVLALTREHRAAVVALHPAAVRRTFTLLELARLSALVDPATLPGAGATTADRLLALVPLAAAQRGRVHVPPDADDVADPYGRGVEAYRTAFDTMRPAVDALVAVVRR